MRKINNCLHNRLTKRKERKRLRTIRKQRTKRVKSKKDVILEIIVPSKLNFLKDQNKTINLLNKIQNIILEKKKFKINHKKMQEISKESLLLLVAEIDRCSTLNSIKLKPIYKLFPKNKNIKYLLNEIGYWDYFNMNSRKSKPILENNLYMQITSGAMVSGKKIGEMIEFFEKIIYFSPETREKLSDALIEASANTVDHAYTSRTKNHIKKWWLTASLNKQSNEISFVFYDQGDGILNTIKNSNTNIKLRSFVDNLINISGYSKGDILKKLITTNLSQYKSGRRGNGLISFKHFIDEVETGELYISTDNFTYLAKEDKIIQYSNALQGTLIAWRIQATNDKNKKIYIKETNNE